MIELIGLVLTMWAVDFYTLIVQNCAVFASYLEEGSFAA